MDINNMIGKKVWFFDKYDNLFCETVEKIVNVPARNGNAVEPYFFFRNNMGAKVNDCFERKQDCLNAKHKADEARRQKIVDSIKTTEDLVQYMYDHTVSCAEEYTDWVARDAVRIAAKNLLGVELGE